MNNETKHTPGPWRTWQAPKATAQIEISTAWVPEPSVGQTPIATVDRNLNTQARFNARLIAAAPELLEACKMVVERIIEADQVTLEELDQVKAAIAKAEGQS